MIFALFALQATALPDIELNLSLRARSVAIEKQGDASLTVAASPDGGTQVDVRAPKANGRKTMRNIEITIAARARIGDPGAPGASSEPEAATSAPQ